MTTLLDGNVLIAVSFPGHIHAHRADLWLASLDDSFATCPVTQGTLLRHALRQGFDFPTARAGLTRLTERPGHVFWTDDLSYQDVEGVGIMGHAQVTDAYLAQLARQNAGRLATFDRGLAALHSDVAELIPAAANDL